MSAPQAVSNASTLSFLATHQAFLGSRKVLLPPTGSQGVVGTLSSPTSSGATYRLTAQIATDDLANAPTFELRLRNSATGAESAAVVKGPIGLTNSWALMTGTVTTGASFDRVVLRYHTSVVSTAWGFVDDVQVCQAALATTGHTASWWTTSKVVGVAVLGAILTGALVIGSVVVVRRRRRLL